MITAAIGAGAALAGTIFGGIQSARQARKAARELARQRRKNQSIYDREQYTDATQRADAQRLLTQTNEAIKKRNRAAAGTQAVMGGTEESVAKAKEANNDMYAKTVSAVNAQGEARKDAARRQYIANDNAFSSQQRAIDTQKANNTAQAIQGVTGTLGSIMSLEGADSTPKTKLPEGTSKLTSAQKQSLRESFGDDYLTRLLSGENVRRSNY